MTPTDLRKNYSWRIAVSVGRGLVSRRNYTVLSKPSPVGEGGTRSVRDKAVYIASYLEKSKRNRLLFCIELRIQQLLQEQETIADGDGFVAVKVGGGGVKAAAG